jgi:hypothetical protein
MIHKMFIGKYDAAAHDLQQIAASSIQGLPDGKF